MTKFALTALIPAVAVAAGLVLPSTTEAATLEYRILVDGTIVGSGSSTTGEILGAHATSPLFSTLSLGAVTGVPIYPSPDLSSSTTSISTSASFTATHTLEIDITQVGLVSPTGIVTFSNTLTLNNLINSAGSVGVTSTYSNYVDPNDGAFAETTSVASLTGVPKTSTSNGAGTSTNVDVANNPYSETQVLFATFTGNSETLSTTDQMTGTPIPEPSSLAILGAGFAGLGMMRRIKAHRRR